MENSHLENEVHHEDIPKPQQESLNYQLECLKLEIDLIDRTISRLETYSQNIKNFGVVVWVGSVAFLASQDVLAKYIIFTAIIPIFFWFMDAWWLHYVKGPFTRSEKITEFLNSKELAESFKRKELVDFSVLDVMGKQYKGTQEYQTRANLGRILRYKTLIFLYGGLIIFSLIIGITTLI